MPCLILPSECWNEIEIGRWSDEEQDTKKSCETIETNLIKEVVSLSALKKSQAFRHTH